MTRSGEHVFEQPELSDHSDTQIRLGLRGLAGDERLRRETDTPPTYSERLLEEAANRIQRLENLTRLFGLLAPGGTAPRTALEQLYVQSATSADASPMVEEMRRMLEPCYGSWTPVLAEAEGITLPTE